MLFPRFVILAGAAHQAGGQRIAGKGRVGFPRGDLFDQVQGRAAITIGHVQKRLACITRQRQGAAKFAFGALRQQFQINQRQAFKDDDLRA